MEPELLSAEPRLETRYSPPVRYQEDATRHAITIGQPVELVYLFWRRLENLPLFMKDLHEVRTDASGLSHWVVKLRSGIQVEWDAFIVSERFAEMIEWQSTDNSEVRTHGKVFFYPAPQNLGTVVSLSMDYSVPGGILSEWLAMFTGEDPDTLILTNLKRLKQLLETDEIPTTEGQSSGRTEDMVESWRH